MRNLLWKLLSVVVLTMGVLILMAPPAQAQDHCAPISGMIYGWNIDSWQMVADFTIGRKVYHAAITIGDSTLIGDPYQDDVWQGTETFIFDFGKRNTIQLMTPYVTEHAKLTDPLDPSLIFHVTHLGTFTNGTGMFKHAYGNLAFWGPIGPGVKLPPQIQAPAGGLYFISAAQGTICGLNDGNEKRD
jgi:hypothetical protein